MRVSDIMESMTALLVTCLRIQKVQYAVIIMSLENENSEYLDYISILFFIFF